MVVVAHRGALTLVGLFLLSVGVTAQEVLLPASWTPASARVEAKSGGAALQLPFFDDFAADNGPLAADRWEAGGATAGAGFGLLPPTVGMLTLDAIDGDGNFYPQATTSLFGADTALSLPIRLDSLTVADSVVMSFYYLPGGGSGNLWERMGDAPERNDSLFLDFYAAADSQWHTVWRRGGTSVDSLEAVTGRKWQYVAVAISDSMYFDSSFRFRFRNYCSLESGGKAGMTGNGDQWNIDYVLIDSNRSVVAEPEFRDVAFVSQAPTMLKHYRAMPARQYRSAEMADGLEMTITNLYSSALATHYGYVIVDDSGDTVYRYDGGYENAPAFLPAGTYQSTPAHAAPAVEYSFDEGNDERGYTVIHTVREGVGGDVHGANDTVCYRQTFANYYAYDDGSAENGYGLTSTASRIYLAYRFDLNVQDTLTAVDMMFNRTLGAENEAVQFYITVWRAENGVPGTVLYRDEARRHVVAGGFNRYVLEHAVTVDDSIFVGFEQVGNDYINLGFDRSYNTADRIYYLTSTMWQQSILSGALMLRPCFGSTATVGIGDVVRDLEWRVYPNPASDVIFVDGVPVGSRVSLYDCTGRVVKDNAKLPLATDGLVDGLYLIRIVTPAGDCRAEKIIVQH